MKVPLLWLSLAVTALQACSNEPKGDQAAVGEKQEAAAATGATYAIDTTVSRVRFTGNGVGKNHPGTFRVTEGSLTVKDSLITSGSFILSITSMDLEQKGGIFDAKLRPHLLGPDFFDAANHPTARFELTRVAPYEAGSGDSSLVAGANYTVSGNLTLKGITRNVTFPARIDLNPDEVSARGNFNIDRRQWGMNYGNDKSLGNQFISETVNIQVEVKAKKEEGSRKQ
jgi:polyisoprenoid-binding protein YceI